jgi:predicted methyltransferase
MNGKLSFDNPITAVYRRVQLAEGEPVIEQLLLDVFFHEGISTKELARKTLLPLPLVAAIKGEFIKEELLIQDRGIRLSEKGRQFISQGLGYEGLDLSLYQLLLNDKAPFGLEQEAANLDKIFSARPQVDVTVDQSKATTETSLKRAVLCLQNHALIGKQILCVGDDDLVSIALGFLLKRLFPESIPAQTRIVVLDVDQRFLDYIQEIAGVNSLPVECRRLDLRNPLPADLVAQFDCFFTDPPYTLPGMSLFLSRGIAALKKTVGLPVFLSFSHKSPDFTLEMQQEWLRLGLVVFEALPRFNRYEGAEIIGNTGQMIVLRTCRKTQPIVDETYYDRPMYTGELKKILRVYQCKECAKVIKIGFGGDFNTIESAKKEGCPNCRNTIFDLIERHIIGESGVKP